MSSRECPAQRDLVGELRWDDSDQLFWFVAFGEGLSDARLLPFDAAHCMQDFAVYFLRGGIVVGHLSAIDMSGVDDPDDYRIAWQLWRQVAPMRARLIESCWIALLDQSGPPA